MSLAKADIRLPVRTPAFVDRETGAAELSISPSTWDNWVKAGILPGAAPGFPASTPRWRWADIDRKLSGRGESDADKFVLGAANLNGPSKGRKRAGP